MDYIGDNCGRGKMEERPSVDLLFPQPARLEATKQFKQHRPDITLMDLQLPDMSGIEAMIAIRQEFPEARIIVSGAAVTGGVRAGDSPRRKGSDLAAGHFITEEERRSV